MQKELQNKHFSETDIVVCDTDYLLIREIKLRLTLHAILDSHIQAEEGVDQRFSTF